MFSNSREDFLSLEQFQIWLENRVKEQYSPMTNTLASDKPYKDRDKVGIILVWKTKALTGK